MNLSGLAFICFCYGRYSDNDKAYLQFLESTNGMPDLMNQDHRYALLKWLNQWGCRQFAIQYHDLAQIELLDWYRQYTNWLFPPERNIWQLTQIDYNIIRDLFESLKSRTASIQHRGNREITMRFGAIGAAKILFAVRPKCFAPWDNPIRGAFGYDSSSESYVSYLEEIKNRLQSIRISCEQNGFTLANLPETLQRPNSSVPKLMDEYFWMTITQNWSVPDNLTFRNWVQWISQD
ncbi:MAG TPA: hypothetical protein VN285_10660 [Candidatus Deferrimicrobium sp.]|nr:hypothetical protein [Candidatus Deferrimicrobium sp.]